MAKTTAQDSASVTPIKKRRTTAYVPTDQQRAAVRMAAAAGYRDEDICALIATDEKQITNQTLRKYFGTELRQGKPRADLAVINSLYKMAIGDKEQRIPPNVAAAIFWAKTRLGWRENQAPTSDTEGKPRGALIVPGVYDVTNWEAAAKKHATGMEGMRARVLGEALKPAA